MESAWPSPMTTSKGRMAAHFVRTTAILDTTTGYIECVSSQGLLIARMYLCSDSDYVDDQGAFVASASKLHARYENGRYCPVF